MIEKKKKRSIDIITWWLIFQNSNLYVGLSIWIYMEIFQLLRSPYLHLNRHGVYFRPKSTSALITSWAFYYASWVLTIGIVDREQWLWSLVMSSGRVRGAIPCESSIVITQKSVGDRVHSFCHCPGIKKAECWKTCFLRSMTGSRKWISLSFCMVLFCSAARLWYI